MTPPRASITVLCIALSFFLSYFICLGRGLPANYALLGGEASALLTCIGMLILMRRPLHEAGEQACQRKQSGPVRQAKRN